MHFWEAFSELLFKFKEAFTFKNVCLKCDYTDFWGKKIHTKFSLPMTRAEQVDFYKQLHVSSYALNYIAFYKKN